MRQKNSIVVFGGSFNPPHNSHFSIAQEALNQYEEIEKIVFVPVNKKYPKDGLLDNNHRYNMLNIVANKNSNFIISDIDLHEERSLFTIEILKEIEKQFREREIWLLIGSDNLKELNTWKCAEELVNKYKILVMERNQDNMEEIIENDKLLSCYRKNFIKLNQGIRSNYSSTYLREQIKKGKSIRYLLPDEVYEYIKDNNLYRGINND